MNFIPQIIIISFLLTFSCTGTKKLKVIEIFNEDITEETICFLVFNITRDSLDQQSKIKLLQTTKSEGKIKQQNQQYNTQNHILFNVIGDTGILNSVYSDHPLFKRMEHSHEEDGLSSKMVTLENEEFFVRIQLNKQSKFIHVFETINGSKPTLILTLKI